MLLDPADQTPKRAVASERRGALLKAGFLILLLAAGFADVRWTSAGDFLDEERLVATLLEIRAIWWAPLALLALYVVLAPLGVTMMPLIVTGAIFGPRTGTFYNSAGLILGAGATFWLARTLGRDFVVQMTGRRLRKAERLLDRHGFWPLVQTRFLPLPSSVVNFGAALAGVNPRRFMLASVVGLVPSTLIHSYFIAQLMYATGAERLHYGIAYGATFVVFNMIIGLPWLKAQRQRRRRYQRLTAERAERARRGQA